MPPRETVRTIEDDIQLRKKYGMLPESPRPASVSSTWVFITVAIALLIVFIVMARRHKTRDIGK